MKISSAYGPGKFGLSFELFPPKSAEAEADLYRNLPALLAFKPSFVTCTYGAGGSTRDKTLEIVATIRRRHHISVASHLTCVEATRDQLREYLQAAKEQGVENVVALRGDPPKGAARFEATAGGLRYANELVSLIRAEFPDFGIAVAGYPETHQEAASPEDDLRNLRRKVDAGADAIITQLFYDNDDFFRFRDRCEDLGIRVPIVPGLLPVTSFKQIQRITSLCKAKLPDDFVRRLSEAGDDLVAQTEVGIEHATRQTEGLLAAGIPGIHFYVLNKSQATSRILRDLGAANFPRPTAN